MDKNLIMDTNISIILPTYNGSKYIQRAIESVISQTYKNWELIIVDDCSSDNSFDIINNFLHDERIEYFKNDRNLGIQKSLNYGISVAKGYYIARIDDDDIWIDKEKLAKQMAFLEKNKDHVLLGTGVVVYDESNKYLYKYLLPETDKEIRNKILLKNCFVHSSVIFQKEKFILVGGYDEGEYTRHVEDYDLWLRLGSVGKMINIQEYSTGFTFRENSLSSKNKIEQFKKNITLIKKYKNKYPSYSKAITFGYLRLFLYKIFLLLPFEKLKYKFMILYKK